MNIKKCAAAVASATVLAMSAQSSQAGQIAFGESYAGDPGTYIGAYNPLTFDFGTLERGFTTPTSFTDYWVFDLDPSGTGSTSFNFTKSTNISSFAGSLYTALGTTACGSNVGDICSIVQTGTLIGSDSVSGGLDKDWEILTGTLAAGRYIIEVSGLAGTAGAQAYTGQLGFSPVPEPGTVALLGIGLLAFGVARRRVS